MHPSVRPAIQHLVQRLMRHLLLLCSLAAAAPFAHALQFGISANPDRVRPGEAIIVALTVANDSATTLTAVTLRLQMPVGANVAYPGQASGSASCPNGDCDPGETITWSVGALAPGRAVRVTLPLTISANAVAGTTITLPAQALVGAATMASVSRSLQVATDNALVLNVDASADGAVPGGTLVYTLSMGNRSGVAVNGATLSLPLPANVSFVSASGDGALSGNTVLWSLGTLQGGESRRHQVRVRVNDGLASGTLLPVDVAQLDATNGFGLAETARATLLTRVQTGTALALTIAPSHDPARRGEPLRTGITVSNPATQPVFNVRLLMRLATAGVNVTYPVYISDGASCQNGDCDPGELVSWNLGTLPAGGSTTVLFLNTVNASLPAGRLIAFDVEATADGLPQTIARHTVATDDDNALTLALDADKDPVAPGDTLVYALTYGNRGGATITGAVLELPLPAGVSLVSASGGGTLVGGTVRWPLGTLLAGQSARQQVTVTVAAGTAGGTLLPVNAAVLAGNSAVTGTETARAVAATRVHSSPLAGLAIASSADPARNGEAVRTALTVNNLDASAPLTNTVLRLRLPPQGVDVTYPSYLSGAASCQNGDCDGSEFVTWNLGTIAPGGATTVHLVHRVNSGFTSGRLVSYEALLTADGAPTVLTTRSVPVDGDNALSLTLHADRDSAAPGERLTYLLDYANRSAGTINNAVLTLPLPAAVALVGSSGGTMTSRSVSWPLGSLLAGTGGRRSVTVQLPATLTAGTPLRVDAATLAGSSSITGAEVARAALNVRLTGDNPLKLAVLSLAANPIGVGQTLTATLQLRNAGSAPLNGIRVQARVPTEGVNSFFPSALGGGAASCPNGDCDPWEFVTWTVPTLAAGASSTFTMPLVVSTAMTAGRQIHLQAIATDDNGDQALASATAMVGTQFSVLPGCRTFGDFDGNGTVGFSDLALFRANFGSTSTAYDLDGNGSVGFADLAIFNRLFGNALTTCSGSAARLGDVTAARR